jgi:hypothetical protein
MDFQLTNFVGEFYMIFSLSVLKTKSFTSRSLMPPQNKIGKLEIFPIPIEILNLQANRMG